MRFIAAQLAKCSALQLHFRNLLFLLSLPFSSCTFHCYFCWEVVGSFFATSALSHFLCQPGSCYRGQFRLRQGSFNAMLFATLIVVHFSASWFLNAHSHSWPSQLVCRCLKPLSHPLSSRQVCIIIEKAQEQLFLSPATRRFYLFWCWLTFQFYSLLSFRVSCPCSFFRCLRRVFSISP